MSNDNSPSKNQLSVLEAAKALLADVRWRYPGEALRCPFMIALDDACNAAEMATEPARSFSQELASGSIVAFELKKARKALDRIADDATLWSQGMTAVINVARQVVGWGDGSKLTTEEMTEPLEKASRMQQVVESVRKGTDADLGDLDEAFAYRDQLRKTDEK